MSDINTKNSINTNENNVFLYWVGNDFKLITILRRLIYLHSKSGNGYKVHLINHENVKNYVPYIPDFFYHLRPAFQADYVRVSVICDYGGIWLDSDTLVIESLDSLFEKMNSCSDGFFIRETKNLDNTNAICNGLFGSKPGTLLMLEWKRTILEVMNEKKLDISWCELGGKILCNFDSTKPELFNNYELIDGIDNIYPVRWYNCVENYLYFPYENYCNIVRNYQPLLILVNEVYRSLEHLSEEEIMNSRMPINYFINKSLENAKNNETQNNESSIDNNS